MSNDTKKSSEAKPFVKWVGGKARLVPQLKDFFPESYLEYYEPFLGGGALFFSINPKKSYINDMNGVLINAYRNIRDNPDRVILELKEIEHAYHSLDSLEEKKHLYLQKRQEFNSLASDDFEKTILLIFINKTCFNGMYRENSKGQFNIPFGQHVKPTICDEKNLRNVSNELQKAIISSSSYEKCIENAKKGDFIYFDPPYAPMNTTSSFTTYQAGGFTTEDQIKLRDNFKKMSDRGCKVMLSNSDTELINDLYKEFIIHKVYAARSINATGSKRGKISEVLVTNY